MQYAETFLNDLDIERLHAVLEAVPHTNRGDGKTMSYIARMVGEALCGEGFRHMYIGENEWFCKTVLHSVLTIFREHGIMCYPNKTNTAITIEEDRSDRTFHFQSVRSITHRTFEGMYLDCLWIDLTPKTRYDRRHIELLDRAHHHIRPEYR